MMTSAQTQSTEYTRGEVALHKTPQDLWIIIDGKVYDVTNWLKHHPGGKKIIQHYGGEDATLVFESFHRNKKLARAYMSKFYIGNIVEEERELSEINKDFLRLRKELFDKGYFKFNGIYYILWFLHAVLFEVMGVAILWWFGTGWIPYIIALLCVVIAQVQALWVSHDFGHFIYKSWNLNSFLHNIAMGFFQGWSASWWRFRHNQHHAKPNMFHVDPDIGESIIIVGNVVAEQWGKNHWGKFPYQHQHKYFILTFALILVPIYFIIDHMIYIIQEKKWEQILWALTFYFRWHILFTPLLGGLLGSLIFYMLMRTLESYWMVLVSYTNHMPMEVVMPGQVEEDWPTMQMRGTRNVKPDWFWNWFTGSLNLQIEHHFFPTMPNYNLVKIQPYVMEFCKKHGLDYQQKPGLIAIVDIFKALQEFGQTWKDAWDSVPDKKN